MNSRDSHVPERSADEAALEQQIIKKGLTAPRLSPQLIDSVIEHEAYFTAADGWRGAGNTNGHPVSLGLLTICVLTLRNGFVVTGESACASPENFDAQIGRDIARRNARDKIWSLEGYLLRQRLHNGRVPDAG
jgi:hypothetical protein